MGQAVCKVAVSLLTCPSPYSGQPLVSADLLERIVVLSQSPFLAGRMRCLTGRMSLGRLQLKSLQICPVVPLAGRMVCLAGRKPAV
jgi:hypothetical protein